VSQARVPERAHAELSRTELLRISLYWLALTGIWAAITFQLKPVLVTDLICPAGLDSAACAALPNEQLTPIVGDIRVKPEVAVGVIAFLGAIVAIVVQPIAAALSDYTQSPIGRRRPWIIVGTALDAVFLVALANAQTFVALAVLIVLLQFSSNIAQGPFQGYVPDLVPQSQVGVASGLVGLMTVGGQLAGVAIGAAAVVAGNIPAGFLALAVLEVATMLPAVFGVADRSVEMPVRTGSRLANVQRAIMEAVGYRSFVWLLVSRLFILMTAGTLAAFAQFFLTRSLGYTQTEAAATILILLTLTVLTSAVAAAWAGRASDRFGRRQLIRLGCLIGAVGMAILAVSPAQPELAFGGVRFPLGGLGAIPVGIGAGMFLSADWALMVDIIPRPTAGRYLGISNVVTATSGAIATAIGGLVIAGTTDLVGDAGPGPRVAVALTLVFYVIGAWAVGRVDPRPYEVQAGSPEPAVGAPAGVR
jgi:MFS family permease